MSDNYHDPIKYGPVGSTLVTAREGIKGTIKGVFGGAARGGFWGGLTTGLTAFAGVAAAGFAAAGALALWPLVFSGAAAGAAFMAASAYVVLPVAATVGLGTAAIGTTVGTALGAAVGPFAGLVGGVSRGRDIVDHSRGAAAMKETLDQHNAAIQANALGQASMANALRAEVIRQGMTAQQGPVVIQTRAADRGHAASGEELLVQELLRQSRNVRNAEHLGQGLRSVNQGLGAHSQQAAEKQMSAAQAQHQV